MTRFVWLRQFEPGQNSADANRLLDRLDHVRRVRVPDGLFEGVPAHRITRLRRQGERYFADGLRELPENRRIAILAVCAAEWETFLADAVIETHDRIVGRTYRTAERTCQERIADEKAAVRRALRSFIELGSALIDARDAQTPLDAAVADGPGWEGLGALVATASVLAETIASDPLEHVLAGYARFRRYTPRMLRTLEIEPSPAAKPLLGSIKIYGVKRPNRLPSERGAVRSRPAFGRSTVDVGYVDPTDFDASLVRNQDGSCPTGTPDRVAANTLPAVASS